MRLTLVTALAFTLVAALPATASAPGRLQVVASEFEYRLSRPQLRSGRLSIIELLNLGSADHNLRLKRVGGTKTYGIAKVLPGQRRVLQARLVAGRYHLWCALPGHRARGMRAQLRVLPPPPQP